MKADERARVQPSDPDTLQNLRTPLPLQLFLLTLALLAVSQLGQEEHRRVQHQRGDEGLGSVGQNTLQALAVEPLLDCERFADALRAACSAFVAQSKLSGASIGAERSVLDPRRVRFEVATLATPVHEQLEQLRRRIGDPERLSRWLSRRSEEVQRILAAAELDIRRLEYRVKDLYSVWRKMQRKQSPLDGVHDLLAMRVVVGDVAQVYAVSRLLQRQYRLLAPAKDYIARPKSNGYRSLHLLLQATDGQRFELQLRTEQMHKWAEAQHWAYKAELLEARV